MSGGGSGHPSGEDVAPPAGVIDTPAALASLTARIDGLPRLGVDTEADSLHSYHEKVCLVQVGLPDGDELVDPLAGLDLTPLLEAFSRTQIVLHGADVISAAPVHGPSSRLAPDSCTS